MFCPNCGSFNEDGSLFCGECGTKISASKSEQNAPVPVTDSGISQQETPDYEVQCTPDYESAAYNSASENPPVNNFGAQNIPLTGAYSEQEMQQPVNPYGNCIPGGYIPPQMTKKKTSSGVIFGIMIVAILLIGAVAVLFISKPWPKNNNNPTTITDTDSDSNSGTSNSTEPDNDNSNGHYIHDYYPAGTVYADLSVNEVAEGIKKGLTAVYVDAQMYAENEIHITWEIIDNSKNPSGRYMAYLFYFKTECDENADYYSGIFEEYIILSIDSDKNNIGIEEFVFDDYDDISECYDEAMEAYKYWIE